MLARIGTGGGSERASSRHHRAGSVLQAHMILDLKSERVKSREIFFLIREQSEAREAELAEDLTAHAEFTPFHRHGLCAEAGVRPEIRRIFAGFAVVERGETGAGIVGMTGGSEVHDGAGALGLDGPHGGVQGVRGGRTVAG